MSLDLGRGLRKISETQAALISQQVTEQALKAIEYRLAQQDVAQEL